MAKEHALKDGAPAEDDPLHIPALAKGPEPIRCYQYVAEPVSGLESIEEIKPASQLR
jgi:hypothetical protein